MADERRDDRPGSPERDGGPGRPDEGRRRFGRHRPFRGGKHGNGVSGEGQPPSDPRPGEKRELPSCPLCGKPVYDLSTAVSAAKESAEPAHFDCVLERVAAAEPLGAGEKLVYLGSGTFGVVEFKDKSEMAFTVKRRIQWEKEGEKKDWRKVLSARISNL